MGVWLAVAVLANGQEGPKVTPGGPAVRAGERFGVISFSLRENYVYPQEVTVGEGWYRIVIDNPHRVTGNVSARLDDERGAAVNEKAVEPKDLKSSFYQRLGPGKHRLRIGARAEWVVAVTVTAVRP